jgi:YfiH family protein
MAAADIELIRPDWPVPAHVHAASTTRSGGYSSVPYASLNLGTQVGDDPLIVDRNRMLLVDALGYSATPRWLDQVHGTRVVVADEFAENITADAAITSEQGIACAIMTADCLPVLFADREGRHVAAAHGGWRGLVAGILENTVAAFATRGVSPDELIAWLGPAIGPASYEVDATVVGSLRDEDMSALMQTDPAHWQLDLYELARLRLAACGVDAVFGGDFCTVSEPEWFFSYRRDGVCGRQATLIWLEQT